MSELLQTWEYQINTLPAIELDKEADLFQQPPTPLF